MMPTILTFVMAWYNLPFTTLLAVCLMLAVMQWIGLSGDHDSEADDPGGDTGMDLHGEADFSAGADADVHYEASVYVDQDVSGIDHDFNHDVGHDVDHVAIYLDHEAGEAGPTEGAAGQAHAGESGFSVLAYLGMGRAPLMVILLLLFGSVGLLGWVFNGLVMRVFGIYPGLMFGGVLAASLFGGSLVSSRLARLIGRALPPVSTTATPAQAMVGRRGTVISPFVDQRYGMVHLRDSGGTLISVFAVTQDAQPIRRGEEVILSAYKADKRLYEVVRATW